MFRELEYCYLRGIFHVHNMNIIQQLFWKPSLFGNSHIISERIAPIKKTTTSVALFYREIYVLQILFNVG